MFLLNLVNSNLLKKVKDMIGTQAAGALISHRFVIASGKDVVKVYNSTMLMENGGPLELTEDWAGVFRMIKAKRKGRKGEEALKSISWGGKKYILEKIFERLVVEHSIPMELIINLYQTPLSYVASGEYTFDVQGTKAVPVKGFDNKTQTSATFSIWM